MHKIKIALISLVIIILIVLAFFGTTMLLQSGDTYGPQINNSATSTITVGPYTEMSPCGGETNPDVATTTENGAYIAAYGLFIQNEYDKPNPDCPQALGYPIISTVEDGTISQGKYKGYSRVIAFRTFDGPGGDIPAPYFFITKDYKNFLAASHPLMYATSLEDLHSIVDKNKVTGIVYDVSFSQPNTITVGVYTYTLTAINTIIKDGAKKIATIKDSLEIYEDKPDNTDFGAYGYASESATAEQQKPFFDALKTYYTGLANIKVKNSLGTVSDYRLDLKTSVKEGYRSLYAKDIQTAQKIYQVYDQPTPQPCAFMAGAYITDAITENDLNRIGKTNSGINIYALKDKNHPILKAQYIEKVGQFDDELFSQINSGTKIQKPTYEEYVAKNPILLFKDAWDRWVIVGEFDLLIDGGCGKPVIYLYPTKPTQVHVELLNPTQFTTDIPRYAKGWNVLADTDGSLRDTQPEKTNCTDFKTSKHGSEYAYDACMKNTYPYIYWSGNTRSEYPRLATGFVVKAEQVRQTLEEKLYKIGLTKKEVDDMVSYWYPEIIKKNSPYYRLTFFQNAEVGKLFPVSVTPKPDTYVRVFLDWEPLSEFKKIEEQKIIPIQRKGFTYVEWGGLRR